jgi:hypothetical protein
MNLLELNQTFLPKENLILTNCSISVHIYKNYEVQQLFVSRVQIELYDSVSKQENFPPFSLMNSPI